MTADLANANFYLGNEHLKYQQPALAIPYFQQVIALEPARADAYCKLGDAFDELGQFSAAVACYRKAVELAPDFLPAHYNLGLALRNHGQLDEAAGCFRRVLELRSDFHLAVLNLGHVFREQGMVTEAQACYQQILQREPKFLEAHLNLGRMEHEHGHLARAAEYFQQALAIDPQNPDAHANLGFVLLTHGDLERGWPEHEWRLMASDYPKAEVTGPKWRGESIAGKTILVYAEQGLGDTIQFVRYLPLVKARGATVLFACQKPLVPLLTHSAGFDQITACLPELPPAHVQVPLLSLPAIFQTTLANIPASVPYLTADPKLIDFWRQKLTGLPGLRVGINWHGRSETRTDRLRDIPLEFFIRLAQLDGVTLVSLQKNGSEELRQAVGSARIVDLGPGIDEDHGPFMDTAAIIQNLDLVITSDTSIAHLAGALGSQVWTALPFSPDWRWFLNRANSPWYPTMRLFRQKKPGGWTDVFVEIEDAARKQLAR